MEICPADDAFQKGNNDNDESTKTQVQLFLEEVMQEVEIVMDDLSVVTQNVTVKLSSTLPDCDAKFCPSSTLYLQAQVQNFLDEIYMKVNEQISSTLTPFGFPDPDELRDDEEQIDVGDINATNHFDKADSDNEVKNVMSNILDNLKDLLCQEDNKCTSVQNDVAISDYTTHKRKVADDNEIEHIIKNVKYSNFPQEILMDENDICVEEANELIIKGADLQNKLCEKGDGMIPVDSKITSPKVEELPTNVTCNSVDDTVNLSQEIDDMTKEQNETDKKDSLPESKHNEIPPELNNEQSSHNICAENSTSVSQIPSATNQENEATEKYTQDDEALKLHMPTDTKITTENTPLISMKNQLQPEGSQKRIMQDTLSASPEKKAKVSNPVKTQNNSCSSSTPKDHLQPEGDQKRSMQDTLSARPKKKAKVHDPVKDQNILYASSTPCASSTPKDHLQPEGCQKRIMQDTLSASPEKKAKVSDPVNDKNSPCTSSAPISLKDHLQTEECQKRIMQDTLSTSLEMKTKVSDPVKDQNSQITPSDPNSTQFTLQTNIPASTNEENNGRNGVEKCEVIIPNASEHGEENLDRKNEDQTVPSLIPANEEAMQDSGHGIVADASLYTSVGNGEKVEEKLQGSASGGVSHITETQDDSEGQNYHEEDTGSHMVPSIHDSEAVTDILQTLQYHSQQPSTVGVPPLLMPVFNVGQQKVTGPLERLPPIPSCTRRKRVGLSRRQAILHLHTVSRELKPLVPKETEQ